MEKNWSVALRPARGALCVILPIAVVIIGYFGHVGDAISAEDDDVEQTLERTEPNGRVVAPVGGSEVRQFRDRDAPPKTRNRLTRNLFFGGKIESKVEFEGNFNLDDGAADDLGTISPKLEVAFSYLLSDNIVGFISFKLKRKFAFVDEGVDKIRETELEVKRLRNICR